MEHDKKSQPTKKDQKPTIISEEIEDEFSVPDGGWGWLVAGGCAVYMFMSQWGSCFSILFSPPLLAMGTSSTTISLLFTAYVCIWNLSGLLVGPLVQQFGFRKIGIFGGLLQAISTIISAFSTSTLQLLFSFSIMNGIGGGLYVNMMFMLLASYFKKRLGIAIAFEMAGISLGQFFGPPFIRYLLDEYSYKGAALLFGALNLNTVAMACLFQPAKWHMKNTKLSEVKHNDINQDENLPFIQSNQGTNIKTDKKAEVIDMDIVKAQAQMRRRLISKRMSESSVRYSYSRQSLARSSFDVGGITPVASFAALSVLNLNEKESQNSDNHNGIQNQTILPTQKQTENDDTFQCGSTFWTILKVSITNLSVLRNFRAIILVIGSIAILQGYPHFLMMVPFALQASGHSLETAAWVVSVSATTSFIARIIVSVISGMSWFNMRLVYMGGALLTAVSTIVFGLLTDMTLKMVSICFWGLGVGTCMSLYNLVIVEFMGKEHLPAMVGTTCLLNAVAANIIGPSAGFIRDLSGSYTIAICFLGGIVATSFIMYLFMPAAQAYDKRREERSKNQSDPLKI